MLRLVILLLGLLAVSSSTVLPCPGDKGPMPKSVSIEDCDGSEKCGFVRGKSFKADVTFTARET